MTILLLSELKMAILGQQAPSSLASIASDLPARCHSTFQNFSCSPKHTHTHNCLENKTEKNKNPKPLLCLCFSLCQHLFTYGQVLFVSVGLNAPVNAHIWRPVNLGCCPLVLPLIGLEANRHGKPRNPLVSPALGRQASATTLSFPLGFLIQSSDLYACKASVFQTEPLPNLTPQLSQRIPTEEQMLPFMVCRTGPQRPVQRT